MGVIRVALVDDHHVVRRGMRTYLEAFPDVHVVGEAASGEAALAALAGWAADVVVMDLLLPGGMDGIEATRRIRQACPAARVVVLTAYTDDARAAAALRAGATGYVRKDASPEFLLEVVRAAAQGQRMIDPSVVLDESGAVGRMEELSAREQEVLRLLAQGLSNREIASALTLGEETVKSHVGSILAKLGLSGRAQVAAAALRLGLIRPDEV